MRRNLGDDRGVSALWVAVVALFLVAAAALAVDTSGAFNTAQTDQTSADLSCLAGVKELPDDPAGGIDLAVEYAIDNGPEMDGHSTSTSGTTGTYSDGNGSEIYVDAAYGGNPSTMYVRITEIDPTYFGKAIGADSTTVVQEAACFHQEVQNGVGMLPIGALAGTWNGDLFDCAAKITGNCGALSPNVPGGGGGGPGGGGGGGGGAGPGADDYRDSVANGIVGDFIKHHGPRANPDPDTGHPTIDCFTSPCNITRTEPGNMEGPWQQGLQIRFDEPGVGCTEAGWFNCDSLTHVLGESPTGLEDAPATASELGWEASLYGSFGDAEDSEHPAAQHYYFNGDDLACDSPRLATVPIIAEDLDWDIGHGSGSLPNGRKEMKFIGFYTIYIREPSTISDLGGPMDADILWFGPDAKCSDGSPFVPVGSTASVDTSVWLISP